MCDSLSFLHWFSTLPYFHVVEHPYTFNLRKIALMIIEISLSEKQDRNLERDLYSTMVTGKLNKILKNRVNIAVGKHC